MINRAIVCGHLTDRPELVNGVCRFELLYRDKFTDSNGLERVYVTHHPCTAFGKNATKFVSMADKGKLVVIEGKLRGYDYADSSGNQKKGYRIVVDRFMILDKNKLTSKPDYDMIQPEFNDDV